MDEIAKAIIKQTESKISFNINAVYSKVLESIEDGGSLLSIKEKLTEKFGDKCAKHFIIGMIRCSYTIQLVKLPEAGSAPYAERWTNRFHLGKDDPRFAQPRTCRLVFEKLLTSLEEILDSDSQEEIEFLKLFCSSSNFSVAYELPIDYDDPNVEKIHTPENVSWFREERVTRLLRLRSLLKESEEIDQKLVKDILKKAQLKTYKTDRVKTAEGGPQHYTNREYRWETHPQSVQFALRRHCMLIELELIEQIIRFHGFPEDVKELLLKEGLIEENNLAVHRCPITLEQIDYEDFKESVLNPSHGKSPYQVGHLSPLKSGDDDQPGHVPGNVEWITQDGNRIQGELSIQETRELLIRILSNYSEYGIF